MTVTPDNWPSIPLAPIFSIFIINTIHTRAKRSEIIGFERSNIPPKGFVKKDIPIPEATGIIAAKKPSKILKYGFRLYLSSKKPITKITEAPIRIAIKCLSIGIKNKDEIKIAKKIGIPPPRGVGFV